MPPDEPQPPRLGAPDRVVVRFEAGERLGATKLNRLASSVARMVGGVNPPKVLPRGATDAGTQIQQMRVHSVRGDFLLCWADDGATTSIPTYADQPLVRVAKPWLLRRTPFDALTRAGITYAYDDDENRTATDDDDHTEDQVIVPSYAAGDVIYATPTVAGGVMVRVVTGDSATDEAVEWLDLNVDGRAWGAA